MDSEAQVLFPRGGAINDTVVGHLEFALRHEGVNLEVIDAVFEHFPPAGLVDRLAATPTGAHIRCACFLWEWLTGQSLPVNAMTMGGYVDLFPGDIYVVGDAPANNPKFRVRDNALGTRDFCPTVRREALPSAVAGINVNFCTVERKIPEREILLASFFKLADNFPNGK